LHKYLKARIKNSKKKNFKNRNLSPQKKK